MAKSSRSFRPSAAARSSSPSSSITASVVSAAALGRKLRDDFAIALDDKAGIVAIRGDGLMIGIELDRPCGELVARALERGLLINVTADKVVRLLPALVFSDADADELVSILSALIREFLA